MENDIFSKIKELEPIQIGIYSSAILVAIYLIYSVVSPDEDQTPETTNIELPKNDNEVNNYESKLEAYSKENEKQNNVSLEFTIDDFSTEEDVITEDDIYGNEDTAENDLMQKKILELEADKARYRSQQRASTPARVQAPKVVKLTAEEEHEIYLEKLAKEREIYEEKRRAKSNNRSSISSEIIEVEAVVYGDQYVLPTINRVELILNEELTIDNKTFPAGTPIFAFFTIKQSRVILEIKTIQRTRVSIKAYDGYDFLEGIYSERAGELWQEFTSQQKDNVNDDVSDVAANTTNSNLIGSAVKGLGTFLKRKRLKKSETILLINDHKVTLEINPNKIKL